MSHQRSWNSFLAPVIALIVMLAAAGLSGCLHRTFKQGYEKGVKLSNEEHLRTQLAMIREAIKKFTEEKGAPPISLDDLVYAQYLGMIPRDPVTNKIDWVPVYYDCSQSKDCINGIKDVHSSSEERSSLGTPYSTW